MPPQTPLSQMTSKSPEPTGRDNDLAESTRTTRDPARSPGSTTKLDELREAITSIDQRHAEGESEFFAGDSISDTVGDEFPAPADALSDDEGTDDFATAYAKAKKTAMNMLAMRDHASLELRDKLLKRDFLPEAIDELIAKLQKSRLLDDEEFAHRYVRAHRERRKLSQSALKRELSKKGISPELISGAVDDVDGEEELARQVAEKKAASSRGLDYEVRQRRILGMLARRGFASSVCLKVTREVLSED